MRYPIESTVDRDRRLGFLISIVIHIAVVFSAGIFVATTTPSPVIPRQSQTTIQVELGAAPKAMGKTRIQKYQEPRMAPSHQRTPPSKSGGTHPSVVTSNDGPVHQNKGAPSDESTSAGIGPYHVASPVQSENPIPRYPEVARRRGQEGTVVLAVEVDKNGMPTRVDIKMSSGFQLLDISATETVMKWRFSPAHLGGISVASTIELPIRFQLKE